MAQRLSCLQVSTGTSEDPKVFIVFSSGWMMSAKLLAWKYIVLNLATCKLGCHGYQRALGNEEHKGRAGNTGKSFPSSLTLSWWQALTDPHKPREPRTRVLTQYWADKTPHCFQSAITTNIYGTQWGSTSCGLSPLIFPKPYMIYATVIPIYNRWSHRATEKLKDLLWCHTASKWQSGSRVSAHK